MENETVGVVLAILKKFKESTRKELQALKQKSGPKGEKGERGASGLNGPKGDVGGQGPKGDTGGQGPKGDKGVKGDKGDVGEIGPIGPQGDKGSDGKDGVDGKDGSNGQDGRNGPIGSIGPQGSKGDQGEQGKTGETGPQGEKGDTGNRGEKGDTGDQGVSGEQGSKGDQGPKGEAGQKGDQGIQGPKGDKGDQGEVGERGEKGDPGETPDITPFMQAAQKDINQLKSNVNQSLASLGGGGSTRILEMDDVQFTRRSNVEEDSILIYNPDKKKFVTTNLSDVLQRIKVDLEVQYDKLVDEDPTNGFTYVGEALPGSTKGQTVWRIKRIYEFGADGDLDILWANGTADFDKTWNDRTNYAYSAD